jgi:hypothetical protein
MMGLLRAGPGAVGSAGADAPGGSNGAAAPGGTGGTSGGNGGTGRASAGRAATGRAKQTELALSATTAKTTRTRCRRMATANRNENT